MLFSVIHFWFLIIGHIFNIIIGGGLNLNFPLSVFALQVNSQRHGYCWVVFLSPFISASPVSPLLSLFIIFGHVLSIQSNSIEQSFRLWWFTCIQWTPWMFTANLPKALLFHLLWPGENIPWIVLLSHVSLLSSPWNAENTIILG